MLQTTLLLIVKSFLLSHLIVKYEPISWILDLMEPKTAIGKILYNSISLALGCIKCASLYVGWIIGGFWVGVITSFIAYLWSQIVTPYIDRIRFR